MRVYYRALQQPLFDIKQDSKKRLDYTVKLSLIFFISAALQSVLVAHKGHK